MSHGRMLLGWRTIRVGNWRGAWSRVRSSASRRVFQAFFFILSPNLSRAGRARSPSSKLVCTCLAGRSATAPSMTTSSATMRGSCENASWNTLPPRGSITPSASRFPSAVMFPHLPLQARSLGNPENPFSSNAQCRVQLTRPLLRQLKRGAVGRGCWRVHAC
jgi:hypothetical protein